VCVCVKKQENLLYILLFIIYIILLHLRERMAGEATHDILRPADWPGFKCPYKKGGGEGGLGFRLGGWEASGRLAGFKCPYKNDFFLNSHKSVQKHSEDSALVHHCRIYI
jgi:hypothetical protein